MSKYVVAVFDEESKAYEGRKALNELHSEGSLTLYGVAVIHKDEQGNARVREEQTDGPVGTAVGMLTGGLIGAIAGPGGLVAGMAGGVLVGSIFDLSNIGVGADFLALVGDKMDSGSAAVVAEVDEYWTVPLDSRMDEIGGTVFRRTRIDFEDAQFEQEVAAWNDELDELDAEIQQASDEARAKLEKKQQSVRKHLKHAHEKAAKKAKHLQQEQDAKLEKLKKQASAASADNKAKIDARIEEVKSSYQARIAKLKHAGASIEEKLAAFQSN